MKTFILQALIKRVPKDILEPFVLEKSLKNNNLQKQTSTQISHASQPVKKCDAKCDARTKKPAPYLWLRNNVFYYRMELPGVNGKRRYKRCSLHTSNYYEAQTMITERQYIEQTVFDIHGLFDKMLLKAWPEGVEKPREDKDFFALITNHAFVQKVAPKVDPKDFAQLSAKMDALAGRVDQLDEFQKEHLEIMRKMLEQLTELNTNLKRNQPYVPTFTPPVSPKYTLEYVLSIMLQKKDICEPEKKRKRNTLTKMFASAGLTLKSEYDAYNTPEKISTISDYIQGRQDIKGDGKRKYVRYLQEFMKTANRLNPEAYKLNLMELLPDIKKTSKADKKAHLPYSEDQLLEIFNPSHKFFKENKDLFWMCVISLFTGARQNAAGTLQYQDIVTKNGLDCIHFTSEGSKIKRLKNEASTRFVPIHDQLKELGFLDFMKNQQKQLKATGSDFIFPRCHTKTGNYNNKLIVRTLTPFLLKIGVKKSIKDGFDFHSFRNNASLIMQAAHISEAFINDIIGWEGQTTMLHNYSNHRLDEIKQELDKFEYDFLKPHFAKWKAVMAKQS